MTFKGGNFITNAKHVAENELHHRENNQLDHSIVQKCTEFISQSD